MSLMGDVNQAMLRIPASSVPLVINEHIPLTRWDEKLERVVEVVCVRIDGKIHINPERYRQLREEIARRVFDTGRWADDGGQA